MTINSLVISMIQIRASSVGPHIGSHKTYNQTWAGNPDVPYGSPYPYSPWQIFSFALVIGTSVLASVVCGLRLYSKRLVRGIAIDDVLIMIALMLSIAHSAFLITFARLAYNGVHVWEIPFHPKSNSMLFNFMAQIIYIPIMSLTKISALVFLLRLGGAKPRVRYFIQGLICIHIMQILAHVPQAIWECIPIQAAWTSSLDNATCIDIGVYSLFMTSFNICSDILVLSIPFIIFMDLTMNKKARNALIGVFMLGIITTAMTAIRLYNVYMALYEPVVADPSYSIAYATAPVECNVAIVTASAPALWPLVRVWFPRMFDNMAINQQHYPDIESSPRLGFRKHSGDGNRAGASFSDRVTWITRKGPRRGQAEFATHTIGGTSFAMRTMDRDDSASERQPQFNDRMGRDRTDGRAWKAARIRYDSDEDILQTYHEFVRETESQGRANVSTSGDRSLSSGHATEQGRKASVTSF